MEESKFQREVLNRLIVLETLIKEQDYKGVKAVADESNNRSKENDRRITKLENNQRWITYLIIGSVVSGVLAFVYGIK